MMLEHTLLIRQRSLAGHPSSEGSQQRQQQNEHGGRTQKPARRTRPENKDHDQQQPADQRLRQAGTQTSARISRIRVWTIRGSNIPVARPRATLMPRSPPVHRLEIDRARPTTGEDDQRQASRGQRLTKERDPSGLPLAVAKRSKQQRR
jgi:hypothetical protein